MAVRKLKTYVLMISKTFPAYHPRKGQHTNFIQKIWKTFPDLKVSEYKHNFFEQDFKKSIVWCYRVVDGEKRHTIRVNYDLWKKRADKINKGEAVLSLRQWTGSPYNFKKDGSKQVEFLRLTKVNIQKIWIKGYSITMGGKEQKFLLSSCGDCYIDLDKLAVNDGLGFEDFKNWFAPPIKNKAKEKAMNFSGAIIHFNPNFKY